MKWKWIKILKVLKLWNKFYRMYQDTQNKLRSIKICDSLKQRNVIIDCVNKLEKLLIMSRD